jgi:hypothetical protein
VSNTTINYNIMQQGQSEYDISIAQQQNLAPCATNLNLAQIVSDMYGKFEYI